MSMTLKIPYLYIGLIFVICLLNPLHGSAQETVFSGLKSNIKRADEYFSKKSYKKALDLYLVVERKNKGGENIFLKIARSYHHLNELDQVVIWYEIYLKTGHTLLSDDTYIYAESLTGQGSYQKAIKWLKIYQTYNADNKDIIEKIWRLQNINNLYEDSSYFNVKPVSFNTQYAEYGPAFLDQKLIFVTNRKEKGGVSKIDQVTGMAFQSLYTVDIQFDSINEQYSFGKPKPFLKDYNNKLHLGTASVSGSKLIFTRNSIDRVSGKSLLQLYWVKRQNQSWQAEEPFIYNSNHYSLSHPTLSKDGKTLYFVSDMPGGWGRNDIFKCTLTAKGWSEPVNMGESVNTMGDETAPFIHNNQTLYFASDGHGGFGGLDIFKVSVNHGILAEVENLGFPINTPSDDFGLILNQEGSHGYFASNRISGGFNDDIFEVNIDLQSYPLIISGVVRFNDPNSSEPSRLEILPNARLLLIDNLKNIAVYQTYTDHLGAFSLSIPYSSKYKLQVSQEQVGKPMVSLEIPKYRKLQNAHEIVVIKEQFNNSIEGHGAEISNGIQYSKDTKAKK